MSSLLSAIIGHLVGDYLAQNDWMALNKKLPGDEGRAACIIHCLIWTLCVSLFSGWWHPLTGLILFTTHYIQDRTQIILWWMTKVNSQEKFVNGPCAPWSVIVVDNVWHIVTLWVVAKFIG